MESMWFDDVEVGQQWTSQSRTVLQCDVSQFASMTGDFNPLHVDHDYAANSPYRQPIAHGLLGLSWVAGLGSNAPLMETIAFTALKSWKFLLPIYFGDTVHVETVCCEKIPRGRKAGQILWDRKLINQKGQVVQKGRFETLVAIRQITATPQPGTGNPAGVVSDNASDAEGQVEPIAAGDTRKTNAVNKPKFLTKPDSQHVVKPNATDG